MDELFAEIDGALAASRVLMGGEIDCIAGGGALLLEETDRQEIGAGKSVSTVDRTRSIHRLGNPWQGSGEEPAVTLHVYSLPHDSCVKYDLEQRTCERVELKFDTVAAERGLTVANM